MGKKRYYKIESDPTKLQKYRQKRKEYMKKISQSWKGWINEKKNTEYARRYRQKLKETDPEKYKKYF